MFGVRGKGLLNIGCESVSVCIAFVSREQHAKQSSSFLVLTCFNIVGCNPRAPGTYYLRTGALKGLLFGYLEG